jgi:hypothetical protein
VWHVCNAITLFLVARLAIRKSLGREVADHPSN